jgi:hypothetical protein
LLADNGRTWQVERDLLPAISAPRWEEMRAFAAAREEGRILWGFKDPRVCFFLQGWKHILPEARVVIVFRHYADAVDSLHRREARLVLEAGADPQIHRRFWEVPALGLRMWMVYNRALLEFAAAHGDDVLAMSFDAVQAGAPLTGEVEARWGLGLAEVPTFDAVAPAFDAGERAPLRVVDGALLREADDVLGGLESLEASTRGGSDA